jgi:hypothetical protein
MAGAGIQSLIIIVEGGGRDSRQVSPYYRRLISAQFPNGIPTRERRKSQLRSSFVVMTDDNLFRDFPFFASDTSLARASFRL